MNSELKFKVGNGKPIIKYEKIVLELRGRYRQSIIESVHNLVFSKPGFGKVHGFPRSAVISSFISFCPWKNWAEISIRTNHPKWELFGVTDIFVLWCTCPYSPRVHSPCPLTFSLLFEAQRFVCNWPRFHSMHKLTLSPIPCVYIVVIWKTVPWGYLRTPGPLPNSGGKWLHKNAGHEGRKFQTFKTACASTYQ